MGLYDGGGRRFEGLLTPYQPASTRIPANNDTCRCGHVYSEHFSGGACSYLEMVFSDIARDGPSGESCDCKKFEFRYGPDKAKLEGVMKEIATLNEAKKGQEVTMQDLENILLKAFALPPEPVVERIRPRILVTEKEVLRTSTPISRSWLEKVEVKQPLEGRAPMTLDEEV